MPAHPTFYVKKEMFAKFGNYSLDFGTAADYELMIRLLYRHRIKAIFIDKLFINMRLGGVSNGTSKHRVLALINDYKAMQVNGIPIPLVALFLKKITKLYQYLHLVK
jgi:glycosyltransferase